MLINEKDFMIFTYFINEYATKSIQYYDFIDMIKLFNTLEKKSTRKELKAEVNLLFSTYSRNDIEHFLSEHRMNIFGQDDVNWIMKNILESLIVNISSDYFPIFYYFVDNYFNQSIKKYELIEMTKLFNELENDVIKNKLREELNKILIEMTNIHYWENINYFICKYGGREPLDKEEIFWIIKTILENID